MFGLDDWIAHLSDGATLLAVAGVAVLLGLRHATDPDHLAAVTTLIASGRERTKRAAARLGLSWGLGHAASLFAFGLPIVLFKAYLPEAVQQAAETAVGILIIGARGLAARPLARGAFQLHRTLTRAPHRTSTRSGRTRRTRSRCRRSGSGSCTGWAEARAWASSSSPRSTTAESRSWRSRSSPSARRSRWRRSPPASG